PLGGLGGGPGPDPTRHATRLLPIPRRSNARFRHLGCCAFAGGVPETGFAPAEEFVRDSPAVAAACRQLAHGMERGLRRSWTPFQLVRPNHYRPSYHWKFRSRAVDWSG